MSTRPSGRSEAGTTLIELLVAVAIMGIAFVTILGGIGTAIIGSDAQRRDASAGLVLTSAAERVVAEADPYAYVPCATDYQDPAPPPARYSVTVNSVAFWDTSSNRFVAPAEIPFCDPTNPAFPADGGLQLIELSVTSSTGTRPPQVEVLQVVKRQVDA